MSDWPGPPPWDQRPTFALDADVTVYWPDVRPCWEEPVDRDTRLEATDHHEGASMIPSQGRTVQYTLSEYDADQINRRRRDAVQSGIIGEGSGAQVHYGNSAASGETYPLVITRVWDYGKPNEKALINGQVLLDGNDTLWVTSRGQGPDAGQWREFPRV